jgi:DNA-binding NarL/FixJ family response regulator
MMCQPIRCSLSATFRRHRNATSPARPAVAQRASGDALTAREWEVAILVAEGLGTRQIAEQLVIAEGTVRVHVERILSKLSLHSRTQLAAWAVQRVQWDRTPTPAE